MSDDSKVEGSGTQKDPYKEPTKKILVSVEGGKVAIERVEKERDELKQLLQDLAEKELEEKKDEVKRLIPETEHDSIDEMGGFELDGYISGLEKSRGRKISTGVVKLRQLGNDPLEYEETPEGRKAWAIELLKIKRDPNHPLHQKVKNLSREARSDPNLLDHIPKNMELGDAMEPAIRDLGRKFTYQQYSEWIKEKAREKADVK